MKTFEEWQREAVTHGRVALLLKQGFTYKELVFAYANRDEATFLSGFEMPHFTEMGHSCDPAADRFLKQWATFDWRHGASEMADMLDETAWFSLTDQTYYGRSAVDAISALRTYRLARVFASYCDEDSVTLNGFLAWSSRTLGDDALENPPALDVPVADEGIAATVSEFSGLVWEDHYNKHPEELSASDFFIDDALSDALDLMREHSTEQADLVESLSLFSEFAYRQTEDAVFKVQLFTYLRDTAAHKDRARFIALLEQFKADEDYFAA